MIGLGQIVTLGNSSNRIHEMRLWESVSRVDRTEAEQGAAHSDVVRLGSKERNEESVPLERYLSRVAKFGRSLFKPKEEQKQEEPKDPIARARANSLVGENAPLGWLTADHHGGQSDAEIDLETPLLGGEYSSQAEEPRSFFSLSEGDEVEDLMFEQEWFLSPCG